MLASCLLFKRSCWFPVVNVGGTTGSKGGTGGEEQNRLGSLFLPGSCWGRPLVLYGHWSWEFTFRCGCELHPCCKAAPGCSGPWVVGPLGSLVGGRQQGPVGAWRAAGSPRWVAADLMAALSTSVQRRLWSRRSCLLGNKPLVSSPGKACL